LKFIELRDVFQYLSDRSGDHLDSFGDRLMQRIDKTGMRVVSSPSLPPQAATPMCSTAGPRLVMRAYWIVIPGRNFLFQDHIVWAKGIICPVQWGERILDVHVKAAFACA
jgi:hypothetical protein